LTHKMPCHISDSPQTPEDDDEQWESIFGQEDEDEAYERYRQQEIDDERMESSTGRERDG